LRIPVRMIAALVAVFVAVSMLAARGESPAAFERRCTPPGCVAPPSNIPDILGRRALPGRRLTVLGATPDFHPGLQAVGRSAARDGAWQASPAKRSVWDGVYSDAQAKRGRDAYEYSCASCHQPDLSGDPGKDVPALSGEEFMRNWSHHTVEDLFDLISKRMPQDAPASLRTQTYLDLVAYLLQSNEFPAGEHELPAQSTLLAQIGIEESLSGSQK
jgi:mono/diheme cytochrome c family protein